jgi:hypothetical protein
MNAVVKLQNAIKIAGEKNLVIEAVTITPEVASQWLKANKHNRPVRRSHVDFLAREILSGNWQVNGQGIVISENEEVLDGQHRLLACIEAGMPFRTLVIYGISSKAFKTMDTGAVRTGSDALALNHVERPTYLVKSVGSAVPWCHRLESGLFGGRAKISNTDILAYVDEHPSLWHCCEMLAGYPKETRPVSLAMGTALYEVFQRKDALKAEEFMRNLFTGEHIERDDVEYILRSMFLAKTSRVHRHPVETRMKMVVLGWNWRRRGNRKASPQVVTVTPKTPAKLVVL